ncbi:MAG TPA: PH domain-containing protein [Candidatus Saccharimonadales bacterium]|nr:PH domain-containing protein [Candidatus Saccharimonadales bacterium]
MNQIYCSNCGKLIPENSNFCRFCGASQHGPQSGIYQIEHPTLGRAAVQAAEKAHKNPLSEENPDNSEQFIKRRRLSPKVKLSFMVSYMKDPSVLLLFILLLLGIAFSPVVFGGALLVFLLAVYVVAAISYNHFFYSIDEMGFQEEYGLLNTVKISIPYGKIQNVNITRSPLDMVFGLYRVCIETAGSASTEEQHMVGGDTTKSEAYLPGVTFEQAKKVHDLVVRKIS